MADAYVPNWIRPADPVQPFLQGYQIGQQRAIAETQAMERQAAMAMRAQENQAEQELQRQRIEEQAAYSRQQLAIKKQEQDIKLATEARRSMAAMRVRQMIASGVPEDRAIAENAIELFGPQASSYFAARARQNAQQKDLTPKLVDVGGKRMILSATGKVEPFFDGQPGLRTITAPDGSGQPVQVYTDAAGKEHIITPKVEPLTPQEKFSNKAIDEEFKALVAERTTLRRKLNNDQRIAQEVQYLKQADKKGDWTPEKVKTQIQEEILALDRDIDVIKSKMLTPPESATPVTGKPRYTFDPTTGQLKPQ